MKDSFTKNLFLGFLILMAIWLIARNRSLELTPTEIKNNVAHLNQYHEKNSNSPHEVELRLKQVRQVLSGLNR